MINRKKVIPALITLSIAGLAIYTVMSFQQKAARLVASNFTTCECEIGKLPSDSKELLREAPPWLAHSSREILESVHGYGQVVRLGQERKLVFSGNYVWPFKITLPLDKDCDR